MKLAIIGSRTISNINIERYIPEGVCEIVSGGASGIDALAKEYAIKHKIKYTEFFPNYAQFKKGAPLKRNEEIAQYADIAIAFWNKKSKGTKHTIQCFTLLKKPIKIIIVD